MSSAPGHALSEIGIGDTSHRIGGRILTEPCSRLAFTQCLLLLATMVAGLSGCDRMGAVSKHPVAAGVSVEIHAVAKLAGPSTIRGQRPGSGEVVFLVSPPIIETADIATVAQAGMELNAAQDATGVKAQPAIEFVLTPSGAERMRAATSDPAIASVAVVVNGSVVSVPMVVAPINGSFQISGGGDDTEFTKAYSVLTGSR